MWLVLVIMQDGHQVNISIMIIIVDEEEREGHHRVVGDVLAPDVGALAAASLVWQIKYFFCYKKRFTDDHNWIF